MRIALGTVQFGLPYGVANTTGQVDRATAAAILQRARRAGIDTLDTAIAYGQSEECLGIIGVEGWKITSKLPKIPASCLDISAWVKDQIQGSLHRLGLQRLAGLLLHYPAQLYEPSGAIIWRSLDQLKQDGLVEKIGVSIYDPTDLDTLWEVFRPDVVQCPYNILDRRLITSGWLDRLWESGTEIHVRSVFLQGLLLMPIASRPPKFARWQSTWTTWAQWLKDKDLTPLQACLAFALNEAKIAKVIVGVDSLAQLGEILLAADSKVNNVPEELNITDLDLINPSRWSLL